MSTSPSFFATPKQTPNSWTNSDAANTKKTVVSAGSNGSKIVALLATSTETANARVAQVWFNRSSTAYLLGSMNVPVNSGFDGATPTVNLLALIPSLPHDNDGQPYMFLESGDTLQVSFTTQVASGKEIDVTAIFANE